MASSKDSIFLLEGEEEIKEVSHKPYESEDLLQRLIEEHPELLAGQQLDPERPLRWILVCREARIADSEDASGRWSVDHLLLDQYGIPTFVEVKRSSDTRIRREVVGQMLEYAANALNHWPPDQVKQYAENRAGGVDELREQIVDLVGEGDEVENEDVVDGFWQTVEENLKDGKVRLLFVADRIPSELRLIIEFLNSKMQDVQVMGLELVQYSQGALRVLVPRAVGQTETTRRRKSKSSGKQTTYEEFISKLTPGARPLFEELLAQAKQKGLVIFWGWVGFSVKVPTKQGPALSILRGFPQGTKGQKEPYIRGRMDKVKDEQLANKIRQRLVQEAGFKEVGKHALHIDVQPETAAQVRKGIEILWQLANRLAADEDA